MIFCPLLALISTTGENSILTIQIRIPYQSKKQQPQTKVNGSIKVICHSMACGACNNACKKIFLFVLSIRDERLDAFFVVRVTFITQLANSYLYFCQHTFIRKEELNSHSKTGLMIREAGDPTTMVRKKLTAHLAYVCP